MTVGGFPGSKLLLQVFRQLTKPLSTSIINFAKRHPSFRKHVLVTPGQYYHWCDTTIKLYLRTNKFNDRSKAKIERPARVREIKESIAIEVGTQLMLETLVFVILATFVVYESSKSANKLQLLEASRNHDFDVLHDRKNELSRRLESQAELIQDLRSRLGNYATEVGYSFPEEPPNLESRDITSEEIPKSS